MAVENVKLLSSRSGQGHIQVKVPILPQSLYQLSVGNSLLTKLQFQSHKFNKRGKITLNQKPFHLALVQSHYVARDNQGRSIPDLVSYTTQQPKYVKDRTRWAAGLDLGSSLLQCNITTIGQADQEKTLWLPLTENFYRGYLLPSGQKYQQLELSFQSLKVVKIRVELGPIHLYKEHKLLIRQQ